MSRLSRERTRCYLWGFGCCLCLLGSTSTVRGQIVPDGTLPNRTVVTPNGNISAIAQGTRVGRNLFHSFREFSIPAGSEASFDNALDIQNIISRVTGGNLSTIDGTIRANGTANLFLINPNGIVFGANAQLNIGGSFIGSTASSIKFADGSDFSATNPQAPPLLLINVPIGLQFGANPKSIINRSQATSPVPLPFLAPQTPVGLQVLPGQTLALVGGDLSLDGNLTAFQGEIHLGSVASPGLVSFKPTATGLALDYTGIQNGNIELSGTASVNASGLGGGAIQVTGGSVTLRDRANLVADTLGSSDGRGIDIQAAQFGIGDRAFVSASTIGTGAAGGLTIRATEAADIGGTGFETFRKTYLDAVVNGTVDPLARGSGLFAGTIGVGRGGDIRIDTQQLTLHDGGVIFSPTFSEGDGGRIAINASKSVEVDASGVSTLATAGGNAGPITINTGKLTIRDAAVVSTATFGSGDGGKIDVTTSDSVEVSDTRADSPLPTNLTTTSIGGTGKAGDLEINTQSLLVQAGGVVDTASGLSSRDKLTLEGGSSGNLTVNATESVQVIGTSSGAAPFRSSLSASTGNANAGKVRINTNQLIVRDGAAVGASTGGRGNGGDVSIDAPGLVEVVGESRNGQSRSTLATASGDPYTLLFFPIKPTGVAGNLSVTTRKLIVRDGASINVTSFGSGEAGTLNIAADAIALDNGGSINASTVSGAGGNINLQARDILLRRGSSIATNAGDTRGGNITIDTDTLVAVPQENSDITADAKTGPGGRVSITAQGIFGIQFRDRNTPESDITATSDLGPQFNGTVNINIQAIDPTQGLVDLPENVTDPSTRIVAGCPANRGARFVVTGRGGLPEDPRDALRGQVVIQDLRATADRGERERGRGGERKTLLPTPYSPLAEAQGWVVNQQGNVELVAHSQTDRSSGNDEFDCRQLNFTKGG